MRTRVVGVTYSNDDGTSRSQIIAGMTESDTVSLERDPYNQYDSNAVKVCVIKNGVKQQIGYLSKNLAADVSLKLKRNGRFDVSIVGVGFWNYNPYCEIEVTEVPVASVEESQSTIPDPTSTPNRPAPNSPIFTPNKPSVQRPVSGPIFTPRPKTESATAASSIDTNPKQESNQTTTSRHSIHSEVRKTSAVIDESSKEKSKNSGCFGLIAGIIVVIIVILSI